MDHTLAATRVAEAHEYIAAFVDEHGEGPFAEQVRQLSGLSLTPAAREVRDASAMAAVVEILVAKTTRKKPMKKEVKA